MSRKPARSGDKIRNWLTAKKANELNQSLQKTKPQPVGKGSFPNVVVEAFDTIPTILPRFSVVSLANPVVIPSVTGNEDSDPAYNNLKFNVSRSVSTTNSIGITQQPLSNFGSCKSVIYGITWARINITDAAATWAEVDVGNRLKTQSTGSIKILWKPNGLGVKIGLVLLGSSAKATTGGICYLFTNLTARTDSPLRLGSATAGKVNVDQSGFVLGYETLPITVWNTTKVTQTSGTICQYKEISPGFYLADVGDCSPISSGINPVNPVPDGASAYNNQMQINPQYGIQI